MGSYLLYACSNLIVGVHWGDMWEIFLQKNLSLKNRIARWSKRFWQYACIYLRYLCIWWLLSYCEDGFSENVSRFPRILVTPKSFWSFAQVCLFFSLSLALVRCNYNSHYETITCCSSGCIAISVIVGLEAVDWINNKHKVSISLTTKAQSVSFHTARQMSHFPHLHPLCLICICRRDPVVQSHNSSIL